MAKLKGFICYARNDHEMVATFYDINLRWPNFSSQLCSTTYMLSTPRKLMRIRQMRPLNGR